MKSLVTIEAVRKYLEKEEWKLCFSALENDLGHISYSNKSIEIRDNMALETQEFVIYHEVAHFDLIYARKSLLAKVPYRLSKKLTQHKNLKQIRELEAETVAYIVSYILKETFTERDTDNYNQVFSMALSYIRSEELFPVWDDLHHNRCSPEHLQRSVNTDFIFPVIFTAKWILSSILNVPKVDNVFPKLALAAYFNLFDNLKYMNTKGAY